MNTYIIQRSDIGKGGILFGVKSECPCCGYIKVENPFEPLGRVQEGDIGKKCVKVRCDDGVNFIWQVENDEQFKRRLKEV